MDPRADEVLEIADDASNDWMDVETKERRYGAIALGKGGHPVHCRGVSRVLVPRNAPSAARGPAVWRASWSLVASS
jgi:hypothetical protein